ncbi:LPXTG cell wall anchor domain-containing protein [Breznakia pachnodae]|uniref:LPXTG-motif cell wall-anchored protein n=1 Tax=Breznakia pachnodae TaxID=265178 RepID=A0ABU0E769_9FIRM|nr:LPXTG cell wall anchor domain-containing protein [Breznakia pachnodae]MDQ0362737.1 LPXTG-motif cell wall-anchored protein [Breznakia pachnodae]
MNIKKTGKVILSLVLLLTIVAGVMQKTVFAASIRGKVEGTVATVTSKESNASVTYSFTNVDDEINGLAVVFEWDTTLVELDGNPVANNMVMTDWGKTGDIHEYHGQVNMPLALCEVTFNFKNAFPSNSSVTEIPIKATLVDMGNDEVEFYDKTGPMKENEVEYIEAKIVLNLPISVEMNASNPTSIMKGQSGTFAATVTNDDGSGVKWSLSGATDSSIDPDTGELTIGDNETATSLKVTATSQKDTKKSATTTIAVTKKPGLSLSINPTSKKLFKNEAHTVNFTAKAVTTEAGTVIKYSLAGANHAGTTIDVNTGELTIDKDETASELTVTATAENNATEEKKVTATDLIVTATSVKDSSKSATVNLKVVEAPEITITIDPMNAEVKQGSTQDFTAVVGNDKKNSGVEWSITGATSKDTKIETNTKARVLSDTATLSVGEDEKVGTVITVEAKSVTDGAKVATATVVVTAKDEVTTPTNPSNPSVAPGGTTQGTDVKTSPSIDVKTGDNTNTGLLIMMLGVSVLGLYSVARRKKAE